MPQAQIQHAKVHERDRSNAYGNPADVNAFGQGEGPFVTVESIGDRVLEEHPP
jgi:hypothetical protein